MVHELLEAIQAKNRDYGGSVCDCTVTTSVWVRRIEPALKASMSYGTKSINQVLNNIPTHCCSLLSFDGNMHSSFIANLPLSIDLDGVYRALAEAHAPGKADESIW